jgi:PAS domain S-box-containing protein
MIDRLSIRTKLIFILLIPIAALFYFSASGISEKSAVVAGMDDIEMTVRIAVKTGEAVHELQKERGITAGFLASQGQRFAATLEAQRSTTDQVTGELESLAQGRHAAPRGLKLDGPLREIHGLSRQRAAVDERKLDASRAIHAYNNLIAILLQLPMQLPMLGDGDADVIRASLAYVGLLFVKEYTGQERALLNNAFSGGVLDQSLHHEFVANQAAQLAYMRQFQAYATDVQLAYYGDRMRAPEVLEVERIKHYALAREGRVLNGITPGKWFRVATAKIDRLHEVEKKLEQDLLAQTGRIRAAAQAMQNTFAGLAAIAVLLTLLLSFILIRNILRQLGGEPCVAAEIAQKVAAGDLDAEIPVLPGDTTSLIASVKIMRDHLAGMIAEAGKTNERLEKRVDERTQEINANLAQARKNMTELENQHFALDQHAIVSITDIHGNIIYANDKFCEISQYPLEELLGKNHRIVKSGIHPPAVYEELWHTITQGKVWHGEVCNRARDGGHYWVNATIVPFLDESGLPYQYVSIRTDITRSKQNELALEEARDAAEAASRAKSDFLATMSHEIRTPMNGIIGMTELSLDTELTPLQREYLEIVKSSADSLLTVINDILDFSKIEAGKMELDLDTFDLRDVLADVVKPLALRAEQKGVELIYEVAPEIPELLVGDYHRLKQVIVNLVGNAIKFTSEGEIVVRVLPEIIAEGEAILHFMVSDTGIGIPPEKQALIFEAFSQADSSTTRKYGGTGLGLTISGRLVKLMGGTIWVESETGQGSTFHFQARMEIGHDGEPSCPPSRTVDLNGARVLVVDDNATNRRIFREMLGNWGMLADTAELGAEGLKLLWQAAGTEHPYQLVILDVMMPEMDGFEVAREIRQNSATAHTPLLILSSAMRPDSGALCRELLLDACLTKPVKQSDLFKHIQAALGAPQHAEAAARRHITAQHVADGLRILLAEDNPINQKLAVRLLEKHGHRITLANNGQEAVELLANGEFDLVLMDMQMPEMDGIEATQHIRSREIDSGEHIPIIAMTANVMPEDRHRCLEAGMDGYVSKPINTEALFAAIAGVCVNAPLAPAGEEDDEAQTAAFDYASALKNSVDAEIVAIIGADFLEQAPAYLTALDAAIAAADCATTARIAHTLKGLLGNFAARPAVEVARAIEQSARSQSPDGIAELNKKLEREMALFSAALRAALES